MLTLGVIIGASALAAPASAEFWERWDHAPRRQQQAPPQHDFFPFSFFGGGGGNSSRDSGYAPFGQPQRPAESTRPPPAKKVETPSKSVVLVIGDSLADWLGYGLEETFAETPEIGFVRKIKPTSGLVRYEQRADSPDWSQAVKEMLATEKPSAIVVMLGSNDRLPLRERIVPKAPPAAEGAAAAEHDQAAAAGADAAHKQTPPPPSPQPVLGPSYEFHTDKWGELYA